MSDSEHAIQGMEEKLLSVLKGGSILFIFPPFSRSCQGALLEPHTLQALASKKGYQSDILYLNILLASIIGVDLYERISNSPRFWMLGERLFARAAHGLPPLGKSPDLCSNEALSVSGDGRQHIEMSYDPVEFDEEEYLAIEKICRRFVQDAVAAIAALNYRIVWSTIGWEQTNCSIAIFNGLKRQCPDVVTLIGGMDCEVKMARGVASLSDSVDHVFSGEPELVFEAFLNGISEGKLPSKRIVNGPPVTDLDALPLGDYDCFFNQVKSFLGDDRPKKLVVSYETSRGCWKGEKLRCAFCGLNSEEGIRYRYKNAEKVADELKQLSRLHKDAVIFMIDHTPPVEYYHDLYPKLQLPEEFSIRYQIVANMTLRDLINLKSARVNRIQPGIEALSTTTLRSINKGTTTRQNLMLMRNALSVGISCYWYMLWGLPGDKLADYEKTLAMLPLLRHLQPPFSLLHVRFERNSLYVEHPEDFGIRNLSPWEAYKMVFPEWADVDRLAFRFIGDYESESREHPELMREIAREIDVWKRSWRTDNLVLHAFDDSYYIHDSRRIEGETKSYMLGLSEAEQVMRHAVYSGSEYQRWAVEEKLGVVADSWYVPLVTASPDLLLRFEE
jgi:ribosomal peptide maturation radical SAM protein 1